MMLRFTPYLLGGALLLTTPALAQRHLYLDLHARLESGYAEGWLLGARPAALQVRPGPLVMRPGAALRLQGPGRWGTSLEYALGVLGCSYRFTTLPTGANNVLLRTTLSNDMDMTRLTLRAHYRLGRLPEASAPAARLRLGWELQAGAGLNRTPGGRQPLIRRISTIREQDVVVMATGRSRHAWAPQLTLGLTARLYHRNQELAFLTAYLTQGLADQMIYQAEYRSDASVTMEQLRARGSALGLTLGLPLRLRSWPAAS